jgi:hypothetical protein
MSMCAEAGGVGTGEGGGSTVASAGGALSCNGAAAHKDKPIILKGFLRIRMADQIVGERRSRVPIGSGVARVSDAEAACEKKKKRKVGRVSVCLICLFQDVPFALLSLFLLLPCI